MKKMILISSLMVLVGVTSVAPMAAAHEPLQASEEFFNSELGELALGTIGYLAGLQPSAQNKLDEHELLTESLWHVSRAGAGLGKTLFGDQQDGDSNSLLSYGLAAAYWLVPSTVNQLLCQPLEVRAIVEDGSTPLEFEQVVAKNNSVLCQTARAANELTVYTPLIPAILALIDYSLSVEL
jgi:hypothetical protein